MSKCKSCGADITWIRLQSGKLMPCNSRMKEYWQTPKGSKTIITPNGEVIKCETEGLPQTATGVGYESHFATCPAAAEHRKR